MHSGVVTPSWHLSFSLAAPLHSCSVTPIPPVSPHTYQAQPVSGALWHWWLKVPHLSSLCLLLPYFKFGMLKLDLNRALLFQKNYHILMDFVMASFVWLHRTECCWICPTVLSESVQIETVPILTEHVCVLQMEGSCHRAEVVERRNHCGIDMDRTIDTKWSINCKNPVPASCLLFAILSHSFLSSLLKYTQWLDMNSHRHDQGNETTS